MKIPDLKIEKNEWKLEGALTMQGINNIYARGLQAISDGKDVVCDLTGVTDCDSAAIALLVQWIAEARRQKKVIEFKNVPPIMMDLARVMRLENIFYAL